MTTLTKIRIFSIGNGAFEIVKKIPTIKGIDIKYFHVGFVGYLKQSFGREPFCNTKTGNVKHYFIDIENVRELGSHPSDMQIYEYFHKLTNAIPEREEDEYCLVVSCLGGSTSNGATLAYFEIDKPSVKKSGRDYFNKTDLICTLPHNFEGKKKMIRAIEWLAKIDKICDTSYIYHSQTLPIDQNTTISNFLSSCDEMIVKKIVDICNEKISSFNPQHTNSTITLWSNKSE